MKNTTSSRISVTACSILLAASALTDLHASGFSQSFVGIPNGTTLTSGNVTNWSQIGTGNTTFVDNTAGYPSGNGLRVTAGAAGGFYMPAGGASTWNGTNGTAYYSMNFYVTNANEQVSSFVMADWSNYGYRVDVDGYNSQVSISSGGSGVNNQTSNLYALTLSDNTWYTLAINGFALGGAAQGTNGLVSIYETASPGTILINNKTITAAGGNNSWSDITFLQVAAYGNVTPTDFVQYDNLTLVPEPSTVTLLVLTGIFVSLVKFRKNRAVAKNPSLVV